MAHMQRSKSVSPSILDQRVYDKVIAANLDEDEVFGILSADIVFDDGKNITETFGFNPKMKMENFKRGFRKPVSINGRQYITSIFARIEKGN